MILASVFALPVGHIHLHIQIAEGLPEEVRILKDILQRIVVSARFEDATPAECEIICTGYEQTQKIQTYAVFDGQPPMIQLGCSFFLPS